MPDTGTEQFAPRTRQARHGRRARRLFSGIEILCYDIGMRINRYASEFNGGAIHGVQEHCYFIAKSFYALMGNPPPPPQAAAGNTTGTETLLATNLPASSLLSPKKTGFQLVT